MITETGPAEWEGAVKWMWSCKGLVRGLWSQEGVFQLEGVV